MTWIPDEGLSADPTPYAQCLLHRPLDDADQAGPGLSQTLWLPAARVAVGGKVVLEGDDRPWTVVAVYAGRKTVADIERSAARAAAALRALRGDAAARIAAIRSRLARAGPVPRVGKLS